MAKKSFVIGAKRVIATLGKLRTDSKRQNNVIVQVGYTASYALFVHEAPGTLLGKGVKRTAWFTDSQGRKRRTGITDGHKGKYWDPQGVARPKFLEAPFRENRDEIVAIVRSESARTKSLTKGLMIAGLFLQRKSQQAVPVEHGNLKASAFTRKE